MTSTLLVTAVDGVITALSHQGQPQWQCCLGAQIFAPLCLLSAGQEVITREAAMASRGSQLPGSSPQHMWLPSNAASTAAAGSKPFDVSKDSGPKHVTDQEAAAAGGAATTVVVGSAEGELHCISCLRGQPLWKTSMGSGISTAATVCNVTQTRSLSHGQTPQDAQMLRTCAKRQRSVHKQEQLTSHPELHSHTDARAGSLSHSQTMSDPHARLYTPAQTKATQLLATCTNTGAVRVMRLPITPSASSEGSLLQPATRQTADSQTSAGTSGKADDDSDSESLQIVAAVQMPGM